MVRGRVAAILLCASDATAMRRRMWPAICANFPFSRRHWVRKGAFFPVLWRYEADQVHFRSFVAVEERFVGTIGIPNKLSGKFAR